MPRNGFWLTFALGAIALGIFGQDLPYQPLAHLIWSMLGSVYFLRQAKMSGETVSPKIAAFVVLSLTLLSLFFYFISHRLTSI